MNKSEQIRVENQNKNFRLFCKQIEENKNYYAGKKCVIYNIVIPFKVKKNGDLS